MQQLVTAANEWRYHFELPKYNEAGRKIIYTVDEGDVAHYEKAVDGYDLINTYQEDQPEIPDEPPSSTGDNFRLSLWVLLMLLSGGALVLLQRLKQRE